MLWFTDDVTSDPNPLKGLTNVEGSTEFITKMGTAIKDALDPRLTEKFFLKLEEDARKANASISNQFTGNVKVLEDVIVGLYEKNIEYGFQYKDTSDFLSSMAGELGRAVPLSEKNTEQAIMLGKAMNVSATEMGKMYAGFTNMGLSQDVATDKLTKTFETARKYGVDAGKLTKTVSENVFKAQAYGFKDGIDGLTKMAAQAQRLGISMEMAHNVAEKAFDPEGAIEMASSLQMLGGNMGGLADVGQLMYLAQSDVGELQNQLGKASASMVDFNKKTGEFSISPEMRRNMKDMAKDMGISADDYMKSAIKFKKEQEIFSKINTEGFTEEQKNLIGAFAEIGKGGEVKVRIPGTDQLISVEELKGNKKAMQDLETAQKDANKTTEQVAKDQLSVLKNIDKSLESVAIQGIRTGATAKPSEQSIKDQIIEANKLRADEENFGYKKLKEGIGEVVGAEMQMYVTTIQTANGLLVGALKSDELNKGLDLFVGAAKIGFDTITSAVNVLSDILKGKPDVALEDLEKSISKIKEDSKKLLESTGMEPEKIKEKVNNLGAGIDTKKIQEITPILNETIKTDINEISKIETKKEEKTNIVKVEGSTDVVVKIESNIPNDLLSKIIDTPELKNTIMSTVNERLSKGFSEKLINVVTTS
jgi:hypothetical protein